MAQVHISTRQQYFKNIKDKGNLNVIQIKSILPYIAFVITRHAVDTSGLNPRFKKARHYTNHIKLKCTLI